METIDETSVREESRVFVRMLVGRETDASACLAAIQSVTENLTKQPAVFVTGAPGTGKTETVRHVVAKLDRWTTAWVNCVECLSQRILLERILTQWAGLDSAACKSRFGICDQPADLIQNIHSLEDSNYLLVPLKLTKILDKADELTSLGSPTLLPFLFKLNELVHPALTKAGMNISVVFISHLPFDHFLQNSHSTPPDTIYFQAYTKRQTLDILTALECPEKYDQSFFRQFVELVYNVFHLPCKNLNEIRYLVSLLFPKYVEPLEKGVIKIEETSKLFSNIQDHMKDKLHALYLRDMSSIQYQNNESTQVGRFHLPYNSQFLLIAAFLASYNPARFDARFFTKGGEGRKKVGKKGGVLNGSKKRQQLLGPKIFPVERMLAIFYNILGEDCIAQLVSLRLIVRTTAGNKLDLAKCKCNVSFDYIKQISTKVRFDIMKYLFDFVDV